MTPGNKVKPLASISVIVPSPMAGEISGATEIIWRSRVNLSPTKIHHWATPELKRGGSSQQLFDMANNDLTKISSVKADYTLKKT